jgi:hypothetical protein
VRITATNAVGSDSIDGAAFTTAGGAPVVSTPEARDIADTSVTLRTSVDSNEFATRVTLQIDTNESFANYDEWFAGSTNAGSSSQISLDVSELVDSNVYYARFVAVNQKGTTTSEVVSFTTTTPVGKLLRRRTDPADPEPVVAPTPPSLVAPLPVDESVNILGTRSLAGRRTLKTAVTLSTQKARPVKKTPSAVKLTVKKRSIAR